MKLTIATAQFPVCADIRGNLQHILAQMRLAREQGADAIHFPETCLSGYAGNDFPTHDGFDWDALAEAKREILAQAAALELWVVLGAAHPLTPPHKPHNSLYIIDDKGRVVDRYDKRFCAGDATGATADLAHYSPGDHAVVFDIKGVRCGALICVDCRYPELYRDYKRRRVELMFHSFHAGGIGLEDYAGREAMVGAENHGLNPATTLPGITQPAMMHAAAGSNHMWISCPNSSARQSCWPSFVVRPDGVIVGRLALHETEILISVIDTDAAFYDSTAAWRARAMDGILHSGTLVEDARSSDRTII